MDLSNLLIFAKEAGGSDLVLSAGSPAMVRVRGEMRKLSQKDGSDVPVLLVEELRGMIYGLLTGEQKKRLELDRDIDFVMSLYDSRFRANVFYQERGLGAVFRVISTEIPRWDQLGLPEVVHRVSELKRGLVLFTGPTGCGKSTTLAAILDLINSTRRGHIITIEDPIEFVHTSKLCVVNHRAVGTHTQSFAAALRSALRESPDVIMVGEMRDLETISLALTAAETGHLVLGTLHTSSAPKTIYRIIGAFPADEQAQVRMALAESLQAVIAQLLLPKRPSGRVAALEILVATTGVRAMIRDGKTHELASAIQTGAQHGMQSLEQALTKLMVAGLVDKEVATRELTAVGLARTATPTPLLGAAPRSPIVSPEKPVAPGKPGEAVNPKYRYA